MRTRLFGNTRNSHGCFTVSHMLAVSKGPRPAGALLPKTAGPSSSVPRPSQRTGSAVAVLGGGGELFLVPVASRQLVQAAAAGGGAAGGEGGWGRSGGLGGGRAGRDSSGRGRGRGQDSTPNDGTLEELQAAVTDQLPGWVERHDTGAISNAFRKAVQVGVGWGWCGGRAGGGVGRGESGTQGNPNRGGAR